MELVVTVGVPITCFVFGLIIGYKMGTYAIEKYLGTAVQSGFEAGQMFVTKQIQAAGIQLDTQPQNTDNNSDDNPVGFDLTKVKD